MDYNQVVKDICDAAWQTRTITLADSAVIERSLAVLDGQTKQLALSTLGSILAKGIKETDRDPFTD